MDNEYGLRVIPHHLLPTTNVFVAIEQGRMICTVTLIGDGELGVPMESIYYSEILELRRKNLSVGEVSCLAFEAMPVSKFLTVFTQLLRLMVQHARSHGMDQLVIAAHPQHARFYQRYMGYTQIGPLKSYPSVQKSPAVACSLDLLALDRTRPKFWNSVIGSRLPDTEIRSRPMSEEECDDFNPVARQVGSPRPALALA